MEKTKTQSVESCDFENKLDALQAIVNKLENDQSVTLEDSMNLYEDGLKLTKECVESLAHMQSRIAELNKQLDLVLCKPPFGDSDEN